MSSTIKMPASSQIAEWKKQHGEIIKLNVGDTFCIVRHPNLQDIDMSATLGEGDEVKIGQIQLDNCWLYGDEKIRTNHGLLKSAAKQMGYIFPVFEYEVNDTPVTTDLLKELTAKKVDPKRIKSVEVLGYVRQITVYVPSTNPKKPDEEVKALFVEPDLEIEAKAATGSSFLNQGSVFLQECFLTGDDRLLNGEDPVKFASYMAGHVLLKRYTTKVEKL